MAFESESTNESTGARTWNLKVAQIPTDRIADFGLKPLLDAGGEKNSLVMALAAESAFHAVAARNTNVILTAKAAGYAGAVLIGVVSNLIARLESSAGIDVLTPLPITTTNSAPSKYPVVDQLNVIVRKSPAPVMENLVVGLSLHVKASGPLLEAAVRMDEFGGYANDAPILNSLSLGTRGNIATNEALLVFGPTHFNVTRTVDRVVGLSSIPILGRLFTTEQTHTNYFRLLLIVSPTNAPAQGRGPAEL